MQNVSEYENQLKLELNSLIEECAQIQNKITEEEFSFELKRKNFFDIVGLESDALNEKILEFPEISEYKNRIEDGFINKTIREILKI
jgi:hypothetical protein